MSVQTDLLPGFGDQVHDGQQVFRAAMNALARPGSVQPLARLPRPPAPLSPAAAALVLALADHETPVWLDASLAASSPVAAYIRFHTGAPVTSELAKATFVVLSEPDAMPALDDLPLGTLEYPDRSATVILQVSSLTADEGWELSGPGIDGVTRLMVSGVPDEFPVTMARNRALFPRGIDVLFTAGESMAALPRTTVLKA